MVRRVAIVLVLVLAGALLAPARGAAAHTHSWRTSASWGLTTSGGAAVVGWVSSPNQRCRNDRVVKVFRVEPGRDALVGIDRRTGRPTGSGDGYINAPARLVDGRTYYIRVTQRNIGPRGHRHLCRAWTSGRVTWRSPSLPR